MNSMNDERGRERERGMNVEEQEETANIRRMIRSVHK